MSLGAWQIVVTVLGFVLAPYVAAKLAVRNLEVERDHARLDELRGVLDDAAAQLAVCERAESRAVAAILVGSGGDPAGSLEALDNEIQPLIGAVGRIGLRIGDDPIVHALAEATSELQLVRNALKAHQTGQRAGMVQEANRAVNAFVSAHTRFLRLGREVVGPAPKALAQARSRHRGREDSTATK